MRARAPASAANLGSGFDTLAVALDLHVEVEVLFKTPVSYGPEDWAQVTAPALVLTGDRDPFMPVEEQVELYRLLPQAELAVWPGVGHAFPKRAELFTDLLVDFVDRRAPSPA